MSFSTTSLSASTNCHAAIFPQYEEPVSMDTPLNLAKSCNEVAFKMATFSFANQYTFLNRTTNESLTFSCEEVKTVTAFF